MVHCGGGGGGGGDPRLLRRPPVPPHGGGGDVVSAAIRRRSQHLRYLQQQRSSLSGPDGKVTIGSSLLGPSVDHAANDDSMQWEDFFGQPVDIASALLDMYDSLVAQAKEDEEEPPDISSPTRTEDSNGNRPREYFHHLPTDTSPRTVETAGSMPPSSSPSSSFSSSVHSSTTPVAPPGRVAMMNRITMSDRNRRPLSASSLSSSSSSSSSSLPRNAMDVKKSYLASIESLDDELSEEEIVPASSATPSVKAKMTLASNGLTNATGGVIGNSTTCGVSGNNGNQVPGSAMVSGGPGGLSHIDRVIQEIVETERQYVSDLKEIIQGYLQRIPLYGREAKISETNFTELFGNIEDVYKFNNNFLAELENCGLDPVAVAKAFVQHSTGFTIYTQYCTNYPITVATLTELMGNHKTAEVFKERQTALHHNLPLGSYLLKPVQRILKYHLLLQNIVKHSDKESRGYPDVKNALSVMTGIAYHINDMKRKHEHAVRVQEIQSLLYGWDGHDLTTYGELVAEGTFRMFGAKALRHIFLFDKMIVIAKKKDEAVLSYKTHIMCSNLMLIESIQREPLCFHVIPFDNPRLQYTFQARSLEQKREWCLQLKRVILENYNAVIPIHARQLVMELGQNKPEDSVSGDKGSSRSRLLSAPEYLEKRKHDKDRRKSEIGLNRAFRLRKSSKKLTSRRTRSNGIQDISLKDGDISCDDGNHSSADIMPSPQPNKRSTKLTENSQSEDFGIALLPSASCESKSSTLREKRVHPAFRAWSSLPEETTDTETEEVDRLNLQRLLQYRPLPPSRTGVAEIHRSSAFEDEYVTLYFAQAHAFREALAARSQDDLADNESIAYADQDQEDFAISESKPEKTEMFKRKARNKLENYDNLSDFWAEMGTVKIGNPNSKEEDKPLVNNQTPKVNRTWRSNQAVRRVQSFTGLARAKVASLHHSMSFRQPEDNSTIQSLPTHSIDGISPTAPAIWLKRQEVHLSEGLNRSGSLPKSFQMVTEKISPGNSNSTISSDASCRPRLRLDGTHMIHQEQRPHTIASDKPNQADFMDDMESYMKESSCPLPYRFPVPRHEFDQATNCTTSPSISLENVHQTIHPEHKIYHHSASKYTAFKNALSNVGSKFAILKASVSPNQGDFSPEGPYKSENKIFDRSSSQSSISSERDPSPRALTNKLMSSIAKAYSAMIKQRLKREELIPKAPFQNSFTPVAARRSLPLTRPFSNNHAIGARMARPLESEYCCPSTLLNISSAKRNKNILRPDSVLSESSNTTTSSDGDKVSNFPTKEYRSISMPEVLASIDPLYQVDLDPEDSPSETSDGSGDSYYERTFEAIESALVDEMFRDSAIYSDPEDADLSSAEVPIGTSQSKEVINSRGGIGLKIFQESLSSSFYEHVGQNHEENDKKISQNLESVDEKLKESEVGKHPYKSKGTTSNGHSTLEGIKSIRERRLELEKWCEKGKEEEIESFPNEVKGQIKIDSGISDSLEQVPRMKVPKNWGL